MKRFKKHISILLIVALVATLIPTYAFAIDTKVTEEQELTASSDMLETSEEEVMKVAEDESLREEDVKHYLNSDGTMTAEKYSYPVHYQKDDSDKWEEIDNTLVTKTEVSSAKNNVEYYVPSSSPLDVKLAKNTGSESLGTISNGEHTISWEYVEYTLGEKKYVNNHTDGIVESQALKEDNNTQLTRSVETNTLPNTIGSIDTTEVELDAFKDKLKDKVTYESFAFNTDLEYTLFSNSLKENIILNSVDAPSTFLIKYDIGDLIPSSLDDKTIVLKDEEGNDIATISAPYMYDSKGNISEGVTLSQSNVQKNTLFLQLKVDDLWLKDKSRVFPVTIDPYITFEVKKSTSDATSIYQSSSYPYGSLKIGNDMGAYYGKMRTYIKFSLPTLKAGDMITGGYLHLLKMSGSMGYDTGDGTSSLRVNAHQVTSSWTENQIINSRGFSGLPSYSSSVLDYQRVGYSSDYDWVTFDISEVMKNWYEGTNNYGLCLKAADESTWAIASFIATDNGQVETDCYPVVQVNYLNNKGLESRWTYHEQHIGNSGSAYVNDYTGNLVYIAPLVSTVGNIMPVDLSLVYNGYQYGSQIDQATKVGAGFRLNIQERVVPIVDGSSTLHSSLYDAGFRFIYEDSDGTAHYFKETDDGKYEDEEGLGLTLTVRSTLTDHQEKYEIKRDVDGSKLTFTSRGYLRRVVNEAGKYIKILYADDNSGEVTGIYDGASKYIAINRDGNGRVTSIEDPAGRTVTLTYADWGGLRYIEYPDTTRTALFYTDDARLNFIRGRNGNILSYSYPSSTRESIRNRVTKIEEYSSADDGSLSASNRGNYIEISYSGNNRTSFEDNEDVREVYQFDNYGRTVCITDDNGNAVNYSYESINTTSQKANTLKSTGVTSSYVANLLRNHNAETDLSEEYFYSNGISRSSEEKYLGYKSIKVPSGEQIYQYHVPDSDTYTFSAYVNTTSENTEAYLKIYYYDASGKYINGFTTKPLSSVDKWQRFSVTAKDIPASAKKISVKCVTDGSGSAYYDCLQLERGQVANTYNMVENGNMENVDSTAWEGVNTSGDDGYYTDNIDNGRYYYMEGNGVSNKRLVQKIYINKPAYKVYLNVRALSKADSVPLNDTRKYAVGIHTTFTDGSEKVSYVNFNPDYQDGWQSASQTFGYTGSDRDKTVDYVYVRCIYYCNANSARFDNIKVSLDETGTSYTYDNEGNLLTAKDNANRNETFTYTNAGMVATAKTADNKNYTYNYSSTYGHRLLSAVSKSSNLKFSFGYDDEGNMTYTRVRGVDSSGNASGKYLHQSYSYTDDGNYLAAEVDDRGYTTEYTFSQTKGLLTKVVDRNDNELHYDYYTNSGNLYAVSDRETSNESGATSVYYAYNDKNYLNKITTPSTTYNFTYDAFGNILTTKAGDYLLSTNTYEAGNGNLSKVTYGNGFIKRYTYDKYGRILTHSENGYYKGLYTYNAEGQLGKIEDRATGNTHTFTYDLIGRLTREDISDGSYIKYSYNNIDLGESVNYGFKDNGSRTVEYEYSDSDNLPKSTTFSIYNKVSNEYDSLTRLTKKTYDATNSGVTDPKVTYTYMDWADEYNQPGRTTGVVEKVDYSHPSGGLALNDITYSYDKEGNITEEYTSSGTEKYTYDSKNQLIRHDSAKAGKSYTYSYDKAGNILTKKVYALTYGTLGTSQDTISYTYGNSSWKDLLTSYDGTSISYDSIGNMTSFGSKTFTWTGRKLTKITSGSNTYTYGYNEAGIRASKTVNGTTTEYLLNGDQILAQEKDNKVMWFFYDSQGQRVGLNYDGYDYYYIYNLQGDVVGIMRRATGEIVATYEYDAWGKCISVENKEGYSIGTTNPFRYRGYYYDSESGFYYVSSRYYNPEIGRFISADAAIGQIGNIQSHNMYAYAFNNPVMYSDPDGNWPKLSTVLTGIAVGAAIVAVGALCVATGGLASVAIASGGSMLMATATTTAALGVAGAAAKVAAVSAGAAVVSNVAESSSSSKNTKSHTVYGLQDGSGKIHYVGRTTDVGKRKEAHGANPARTGLTMTILADNLTYEAARGVEQTYMLYYHTINTQNKMNNQINGISPKNKNLGIYMEAAQGALGYAWNQVSNEVLYWTGN